MIIRLKMQSDNWLSKSLEIISEKLKLNTIRIRKIIKSCLLNNYSFLYILYSLKYK